MDKTIKVVSRVFKRYFSDGVARASAQLAYYLFFSIFPILIVANDVIGRFGGDIIYIIQGFDHVLPEQVLDIAVDYLEYLGRVEAPYVLPIAILTTIYAMTRCFNSLLTSVRQAYRIKKAGTVNYLTAALISGFLVLSFIVLSVVIFGGEFAVTKLEEYVNIPRSITSFLRLLKFVLLPAYMMFVLIGFYYIVPSRRYKIKYSIPGAAFAMIGLTLVTWLFSVYVSRFSNYSILYGSLAAVMILMIWLHMVSTILILGGELNGVLIEMDSEW